MDDRIHFIEHKSKKILLVDCSHANAHQMLLLLEHLRITVAQHGHESVVTLGDLTDAEVDRTVATKIKEVLTLDRPFVKKTAWEKIPADVRPKLLAISRELGKRVDAEVGRLNADAVAAMKKQGLTVVEVDQTYHPYLVTCCLLQGVST